MERILKTISASALILIISLFLLFSVSGFLNWFYETPTSKTVKGRFNQKFPEYKFVSVATGDGHSEWVVYYITYKKPNDERIYEAIWEYHLRDGNWVTYGGEGKIKG
jgi:hypothetical protein